MAMTYQITYTPGRGEGLAVLFSGLRYGTDRPLLAMARRLMWARGADIAEVNFTYAEDAGFLAAGHADQFARIKADGVASLRECRELGAGTPLTLIGKSLGTIAMGGILRDGALPRARYVWLTPSLSGTPLRARMAQCPGPSLSLIGEHDPSVEMTRRQEYQALPGMRHVEVAGVDHGWEGADSATTEAALAEAARVMEDWLDALPETGEER